MLDFKMSNKLTDDGICLDSSGQLLFNIKMFESPLKTKLFLAFFDCLLSAILSIVSFSSKMGRANTHGIDSFWKTRIGIWLANLFFSQITWKMNKVIRLTKLVSVVPSYGSVLEQISYDWEKLTARKRSQLKSELKILGILHPWNTQPFHCTWYSETGVLTTC